MKFIKNILNLYFLYNFFLNFKYIKCSNSHFSITMNYKYNNNYNNYHSSETQNNKKIIIVHGTFNQGELLSAQTTYEKVRSKTQGIRRTARQLASLNRKSWNMTYHKEMQNEDNGKNYKNRGKLLESDKLPIIIGLKYGLQEIEEGTISQTANEKILYKLKYSANPSLNNKILVDRFSNNRYYVFNWHGDLHADSRKEAATKFACDLITKITDRETEIMILAYSHGGNVALDGISKVQMLGNNHITICLLATPIGKKTLEWLDMLNLDNTTIYNFYSPEDWFQKDPTYCLPSCSHTIPTEKKNRYNIKIEYEKTNEKSEKKIEYPDHGDFYAYNDKKNNNPIITEVFNMIELTNKLRTNISWKKSLIYYLAQKVILNGKFSNLNIRAI
jgi:hypothetical protein